MLERNGTVLTQTAHLSDDSSGASVRAFLTIDDPEGSAGYDLAPYLET